MPLRTSTTPVIMPIASAVFVASASSWPGSSEKILISTGCGTAVRSPIRSSISCASSIFTPGTSSSTWWRTSSMISSIDRRGGGFKRIKKSPSFASVTPPPSWVPVRRE